MKALLGRSCRSCSCTLRLRKWLWGRKRLASSEHSGIGGAAETDDAFGQALAVADIDGDGFDDIIVGAQAKGWMGAVQGIAPVLCILFMVQKNGASGTNSKWFFQDSAGWPDNLKQATSSAHQLTLQILMVMARRYCYRDTRRRCWIQS